MVKLGCFFILSPAFALSSFVLLLLSLLSNSKSIHADGSGMVGLAMVVVESAVTSIYICYAEDPSLIQRWDAEFFNQMSEALHQRLQHRSTRAGEVTNRRLNAIQGTLPI